MATIREGIILAPGANVRINVAGKTADGSVVPLAGGAQLAWTIEGGNIGVVTTGHDGLNWTPYGVLHVAPDANGLTGYIICEVPVGLGTVTGRTVDVTVQEATSAEEITELVLTFQT